jgi:cold shock CspA family protein
MTGITHHWNPRGRYGKITGRDRRQYFVHQLDLVDGLALPVGRRVTFTPTVAPRGLRAVAVRLLEPAPVQEP